MAPSSDNDKFAREDRHLTARLEERIKNVQEDMDEFKDEYVTRKEFLPIQRAVYSAIGIILTSFLGSAILLIWKSGVIH